MHGDAGSSSACESQAGYTAIWHLGMLVCTFNAAMWLDNLQLIWECPCVRVSQGQAKGGLTFDMLIHAQVWVSQVIDASRSFR